MFCDQILESNKELPIDLQAKMESSSDENFSNVRLHKNSKKAKDIGSLALLKYVLLHLKQTS